MFIKLVGETDNVVFAEKFKDKKPKEIKKSDYAVYVLCNQRKAELYQQALRIKGDAEVRKKMEECQSNIQQIEAFQEKKQKQKQTMKNLGNIILR